MAGQISIAAPVIAVSGKRKGPALLNPPRGNWKAQTRGGLYGLAIIDERLITTLGPNATPKGLMGPTVLDPNKDQLEFWFSFPTNPERVHQRRPPAVTVTPLQNGGTHIEDHGERYVYYQISGQTGIRPHRIPGSKIPVLGTKLPSFLQPAPSELTGLAPEERTGFDDMKSLRNFFIRYHALRQDPRKKHIRMAFFDNYLGESYIVVPHGDGFVHDRTSASPMSPGRYEIHVRGIQRLEVRLAQLQDAFAKKEGGFAGFLNRIRNATNQIQEAFDFATAALDRTAGLAQKALNTVINPTRVILQGLNNLVGVSRGFFAIPRNTVRTVANDARELVRALEGWKEDAQSVNPFHQLAPLDPFYTEGISTERGWLIHHFRRMAGALVRLAAEDRLYTLPHSVAVARRAAAYTETSGDGSTSSGELRNAPGAGGARAATLRTGETIVMAARRLLGDGARWQELALLNNLRSPYISPAGDGRNVLRPTDRILYPADGADGDGLVIQRELHDPLLRQLGSDWRMVANQFGKYDYAWANGDIELVSGAENYSQWTVIALHTPRGKMPLHPTFGLIGVAVGHKQELTDMVLLQASAKATLLSDERTESVGPLRFALEGTTVRLIGSVVAVGGGEALSLNRALRR